MSASTSQVSSTSLSLHSTAIMVDLISSSPDEARARPTLQSFMENEENYDVAFCDAWDLAFRIHQIKDAKSLIAALNCIQKAAISHLPNFKKVPGGFIAVQGLATRGNYYGLNPHNLASDAEGIKDIIRKIWIERNDDMDIVFKDSNAELQYIITSNDLLTGEYVPITLKSNIRKKSIDEVFDKVLPLYLAGPTKMGYDPTVLFRKSTPDVRQGVLLSICERYFSLISKKNVPSKKMEIIAETIRDIMQLHIYYDGNGRSLYIMANVLMVQNELEPFYPRNMCMFDGNSMPKMIQEIGEGQKRFAESFGSLNDLNGSLNRYKEALLKLSPLTAELPDAAKKAFNLRNFGLLLRYAATLEAYFDLLQFLLNNKDILPIDIYSKGVKSGNALDVAIEKGNVRAKEMLESYQLVPTKER